MNSTPVIFLRSLIFNIAYWAWSMLASILFAPLFAISHKAAMRAGRPWALGVLWLARVICGITHEIRGQEHFIDGPVIYASKHQSAWDTVIFLTLFKTCPAYVLKRELLRIPLWGWYLWRMKMIAIDRSGQSSTMKQMIRDSKEAQALGRAIIIFPEGTRTKAGTTSDYHPGVIALYSFLKTPVVPVALNSGCYWAKNAFLKRPGHIIMEYLPAIPQGLNRDAFNTRLHEAVETRSMALYHETNPQS